MLKLEEKDYDLNSLFNFNFTFDFKILKDVLTKLASSNINLEKKVNNLEKSNKEKNKRLSILENKLNIIYIPEKNSFSDIEESIENKENKNIEVKDNEKKEEKNNQKKEEKKEKEEKAEKEEKEKKEVKKDMIKEESSQKIQSIIIKKEKSEEDNKEDEEINEDDEKQMKSKKSFLAIKSLKNFESKYSSNPQAPQINYETIKSLLKLIKENTEKIGKLEKNIIKKVNRNINELDKNLNDLNFTNSKEHGAINERIKEFNDKIYDLNDKINNLIVKTAAFDTISIFKDSGSGNINAVKAMISISEEKMYKKIQMLEKKHNEKNTEITELTEKLEKSINQINLDLVNQQNINSNLQNDKEEEIQNLKNLIEEKYNYILKIINEFSDKIKNGDLIENKFNELLKKRKPQQLNIRTNSERSTIIPKRKTIKSEISGDIGDNISEIKEYIKALNKKLNDFDSNYQLLFDNSDLKLNNISKKIEEMDSILEKKITKADLKSLENKNLEFFDELRYIQDKFVEINESIKKLSENSPVLVKKLESLNQEIFTLKKRETKEIVPKMIQPKIDLSRFLEENKLREIIKPINKNLEKLLIEKDSILSQVIEIKENLELYETKERVMSLEEEMNEKLTENINNIARKYAEKTEMNKYFKSIDLKLKVLDSIQAQQSKDTESWILAKKPVGCFNCASCEANLKNVSPTSASNEHSFWNKYPQSERQYHIGQGFSKLLKKVSNENPKNIIERTELFSDIDLNKSNLIKNINKIKGKKWTYFYKSNERENMKENIEENNSFRTSRKSKLPIVNSKKKKVEDIPLTEEEKEEINKSMIEIIKNSPMIMKIKKKNLNEDLGNLNSNQKSLLDDFNNQLNSSSTKTIAKLERNKSMPLYENV